MKLRILNSSEVRQALPMEKAIEAIAGAYQELSRGEAQSPLRSRLHSDAVGGVSLIMPAKLSSSGATAVKLVSVFPQNGDKDLPTIHAAVLVINHVTGEVAALLEGGVLTAIRTGAASGVATQALARQDARTVAIFGAGVQARTQLEAVCTVRAVEQAWVFDPNPEKAQAFAEAMAGVGPIPALIRVADSPQAALGQADIVCTATTSSTPVFPGEMLNPGAHVNGVGSFTPEMEEVDVECLRRARVFVDSRQAALEEAGDLLGPIRRGELSEGHILAEIGEVLSGGAEGRTAADQITYFKSVGVAVQDAAAAHVALQRAEAEGLGHVIDL